MIQAIGGALLSGAISGATKSIFGGGSGAAGVQGIQGGHGFIRKDPRQQAFENLQLAQRMADDAQAALAGSERHPITGAPPREIRAKAEYDRLVADAIAKIGGPEQLARLLSEDPAFSAYSESRFI